MKNSHHAYSHSFIFCLYTKYGVTKGQPESPLEEKAKTFSYQYLRISICSELVFFIGQILPDNFRVLSIKEWEDELKRQLDAFLSREGIEQNLPSALSQGSLIELEKHNTWSRNNEDGYHGGVFTFYPNRNRTEVRRYASGNEEENIKEERRNKIIEMIDNIRKKQNPNCGLYHTKLKALEDESLNTSTKRKEMLGYKNSISKKP